MHFQKCACTFYIAKKYIPSNPHDTTLPNIAILRAIWFQSHIQEQPMERMAYTISLIVNCISQLMS